MKIKCPRFFSLFLILSFSLCSISFVEAQTAPSIKWEKSYGGTNDEEVYSFQQTTDGGYIVAGLSNSTDGDVTGNHQSIYGPTYDYWIVKLDSVGGLQWEKSLGGSGVDVAYSIQQTKEGGYIVAGASNSTDGDVTGYHPGVNSIGVTSDYWIVKLDSAGGITWEKSLGGIGDDFAYSIQQTTDGGYIVAGYSTSADGDVTGHHGDTTTSDYWIVKLHPTGDIQWEKSLGGSNYDQAQSIQQTKDGGYIIAGLSNSANGDVTGNHGGVNNDDWVVKLDSIGTLQWEKSLGGTGDDRGYSIQQTTDKGYIVAGFSNSTDGDVTGNHGNYDYWIVKLDSTGAMQWEKSLGGSNDDEAYSIRQTTDGGYIVAGESLSIDGDITGNHGYYDYWIVKLSSDGGIQWEKALGGSNSDGAEFANLTNDGGCIVAGSSNSSDGEVTGNHPGTVGPTSDYWIVKLGITTDVNTSQSLLPTDFALLQNFPNPFSIATTIDFTLPEGENITSLKVYNQLGREVADLTDHIHPIGHIRPMGNGTVEFDASNLSAGMYFYRLTAGKDVQSGTMAVVK